jgi:hypothetical protein
VGIERPPPTEKRAGSFVANIDSSGAVKILERNRDLAAGQIVSLGDQVAIMGYLPAETHSSAVWRLTDWAGAEKWRYVESETRWDFPVDIMRVENGYITISLQRGYTGERKDGTVRISQLDLSGQLVRTAQYPLQINGGLAKVKGDPIKLNGGTLLVFGGSEWVNPDTKDRFWINPITGSTKICSPTAKTEMLIFDQSTLAVKEDKVVDDMAINSLTETLNNIYVTFSRHNNCRLESSVSVGELSNNLEIKSLFNYDNVNSIQLNDIEANDNYIAIAGSVSVFLPAVITKEIMTIDQLRNIQASDPWAESFWDSGETHTAAMIAVVSPDGTLLADRVFPDARGRSLAAVSLGSRTGELVGVGSAYGDRGWAIGIKLAERRPNPN